MRSSKKISGVVILPVILLMTAIVVELAIAGVVVATAFNNTFFGERLETEAVEAAHSGAEDAIMKILRTCSLTSCPASYSFTVGSRASALVTISRDVDPSRVTITSTGTALNRQKKMEVILAIDQTTGQIKIQSFREIAL